MAKAANVLYESAAVILYLLKDSYQAPPPYLDPHRLVNGHKFCPVTSSLDLPLLLLPVLFPSIRVFSNESALHIRWPKYWSCSISPSSEYSVLISFRTEWFNLLAVQGILKSLLQHHSSKHEFFGTQPSLCDPALTSIHDYWKIHSFDYTVFCQQSKGSVF